MPHPRNLLGVLFENPHNAALIMLLTDTYITGEAACSFVYDGDVRKDVRYDFRCTGMIVQARLLVSWLSKEGAILERHPDTGQLLLGTLRKGHTEYNILVSYTWGRNVIECATDVPDDVRPCFVSGTECTALLCNESEEDDINLADMQGLTIDEGTSYPLELYGSVSNGPVRTAYMPTDERTVRVEYYNIPIWGENALLTRYIDHIHEVNLKTMWQRDQCSVYAEHVTMLTMDDDVEADVHELGKKVDSLAFVKGWLAQLAVGLGVVSLNDSTGERTMMSKLAHSGREVFMTCGPSSDGDVSGRWPEILDGDFDLAGLEEMSSGLNRYYCLTIGQYEDCPVPV